MTRFVKVTDTTEKSVSFINLDLVTMVQCSVEVRGGGFEITTMAPSTIPKHLVAAVRLSTANGNGEIIFEDVNEAQAWLKSEFGITVPIEQIAYRNIEE